MAAGSTAALGRSVTRQRESLIGVAWGARPKPGPDSPANVSKRGLSARHYVPNQTLIMVNARLPKGNLAGKRKRAGQLREPGPGSQGASTLSRQTEPAQCVLAAQCARVLHQPCPSKDRGRRESRVPTAPAARVQCSKHTVVTTGTPEHPAFPAQMVLTVSFVLSPATNSFCHRRQRING